MKNCVYCGAQIEDENLFCTECGKPIPQGKVCPHCGAPVNDGDAFCQNCGKRHDEATSSLVASTSKACPYCGTPMNDGDAFCQNCGKRPKEKVSFQSVTYTEPKSPTNWKKIITIVLCIILLAGLGVGGYFVYTDHAEKKAKEEARLKAEQEAREEQQRLAELDAADWERATVDGTEQGYIRYLNEHADGKHVEDARTKLAHLEKERLTDNELYDVRNVVQSFFYNAANGDEEGMLRHLSPTMSNFLGKTNATKVDAISFMRRLHADDVYSVDISLDTNDIQVSKALDANDSPVYTVDFSYDQRVEREDTSLETFASMKGHAVLNDNYKITSLTLKKLSSY